MEKLIELFKKLEQLSNSFDKLSGFEDVLSNNSDDVKDEEFNSYGANFSDIYKGIGLSPFDILFSYYKTAGFYINKIQKLYFESCFEKICTNFKEIFHTKNLNFFEKNTSAAYFETVQKFLPNFDFEIESIEESFSKGFSEINSLKQKDVPSIKEKPAFEGSRIENNFIFRDEDYFMEFGEKLAFALKETFKNKDRSKGY